MALVHGPAEIPLRLKNAHLSYRWCDAGTMAWRGEVGGGGLVLFETADTLVVLISTMCVDVDQQAKVCELSFLSHYIIEI